MTVRVVISGAVEHMSAQLSTLSSVHFTGHTRAVHVWESFFKEYWPEGFISLAIMLTDTFYSL